jgi:hypothetical protein
MFVGFAVRLCVAAVFVLALYGKVRSGAAIERFAGSLVDLKLVSRRWSRPVTLLVLGVEGLTAVLLVVPVTGRIGAILAVAVLVCFTGALLVSGHRGGTGSCPCFGTAQDQQVGAVRRIELARNALLVVLASTGAALDGPVELADPGIVPAVVLAAVSGLLISRADDLTLLLRRDSTVGP